MYTKLLLCFVYLIPMVMQAGEDEDEKGPSLLSCRVKNEFFSFQNEEGKEDSTLARLEEEHNSFASEDEHNSLASNDDGKDDDKGGDTLASNDDEGKDGDGDKLASNEDEDKDGDKLASNEDKSPDAIV